MEDIEIDDDRFMSFCIKFKYLGSYFCTELETPDEHHEQRISQAALFGSMKKQLLSNKSTDRYQMLQTLPAIVVNIALWGSEAGH
jgi:hypothetical protein